MDRRRYSDRREYLINAVRKRRKRIRQMSIKYKGDKCQLCGYNRCMEAMEFHHIASSKKDFGISQKGYTRSWKKVKRELDKCIMLCANCHREVHAGLQLPREIVVEKSGEFREVHQKLLMDNPEPSLENKSGKVQRLSRKGVPISSCIKDGEAPDTLNSTSEMGDKIVQVLK